MYDTGLDSVPLITAADPTKRVYMWLEVQLVFDISAACYRKYFFCCYGLIAYNQRVKCAENSSVWAGESQCNKFITYASNCFLGREPDAMWEFCPEIHSCSLAHS